jgi:hypothetical protein
MAQRWNLIEVPLRLLREMLVESRVTAILHTTYEDGQDLPRGREAVPDWTARHI